MAGIFVYVENIILKVELITLTCYLSLFYLIKNNPFEDPIDWKIEVINEVCLLVANLWCLAFSDINFDNSPEERVKLGWFYFFIIAAILTMNLYYFFKRSVYLPVIEWLDKRKAKQLALLENEAT